MHLSFFAYVDESTDADCPAGSFREVPDAYIKKGDKHQVETDKGGYDLIGLGGFVFTDKEDLKQQVNVILTEMGI